MEKSPDTFSERNPSVRFLPTLCPPSASTHASKKPKLATRNEYTTFGWCDNLGSGSVDSAPCGSLL